jgi:CYTH domain-containing protein
MAKEIEYKFLVKDVAAATALTPLRTESIVQGYFTKPGESSAIRVRASQWENGHQEAFITVKSQAKGLTRDEWEYEIPVDEAMEMMALCENRFINKTRYFFQHGDHVIELDIFDGELSGLVVAEIEVKSEDEKIVIPEWFGRDVTHDNRYTNISLALHGMPEAGF